MLSISKTECVSSLPGTQNQVHLLLGAGMSVSELPLTFSTSQLPLFIVYQTHFCEPPGILSHQITESRDRMQHAHHPQGCILIIFKWLLRGTQHFLQPHKFPQCNRPWPRVAYPSLSPQPAHSPLDADVHKHVVHTPTSYTRDRPGETQPSVSSADSVTSKVTISQNTSTSYLKHVRLAICCPHPRHLPFLLFVTFFSDLTKMFKTGLSSNTDHILFKIISKTIFLVLSGTTTTTKKNARLRHYIINVKKLTLYAKNVKDIFCRQRRGGGGDQVDQILGGISIMLLLVF